MITTDINLAVEKLRRGGLLGIPTETVYGLAAVAYDKSAVESVFKAKNRPFFDPLIVHIGRWSQVKDVADPVTPVEAQLLENFWPGPFTIIKNKKEVISDLITSGSQSVAIRMPAHEVALELLNRLDQPVVAPSANQFGKTSATTAYDVAFEFPDDLLILDGGPCQIGIESTIVSCTDEEVIIHRPGGVSRESLKEALEKGGFKHNIVSRVDSAAPGQLKHHYQPTKPLFVYRSVNELNEHEFDLGESYSIELPSEASLAARTLYSNLRRGDASTAKSIVMKWDGPMTGDWEGIWDRVQRAATSITF